jgi:hypothetical protein
MYLAEQPDDGSIVRVPVNVLAPAGDSRPSRFGRGVCTSLYSLMIRSLLIHPCIQGDTPPDIYTNFMRLLTTTAQYARRPDQIL